MSVDMCIQTIVVAKLDVDVGIDIESFVVVLSIGRLVFAH